ncbi:MAG TPA: hypothetical protein VIF62_34425, partial [Labilithrix sp.]
MIVVVETASVIGTSGAREELEAEDAQPPSATATATRMACSSFMGPPMDSMTLRNSNECSGLLQGSNA